jgi:uncharacterized lipoprotein YajG
MLGGGNRFMWRSAGKVAFLVAMLICLQTLTGCIHTPHEVALAPQLDLASTDVGKGTTIHFRFVDERPDTLVGLRGYSGMGEKITAQGLPALVEAQLRNGLKRKGYEISDIESSHYPTVTYRLLSFQILMQTGGLTVSDHVSAALAADAQRESRTYNQVYRYNFDESDGMAAPTAGAIDTKMNRALNVTLNQALSDQELDRFLTTD